MDRTVYRLRAGDIGRLRIYRDTIGTPGPHEVVIEVKAIGLNFADVFAALGLYSATPTGVFTPGLEFSGEVIFSGTMVKTVNIGDRVMGVMRFGAFASHVKVSADQVVSLNPAWSFEQGAAFLVQVLTAYYGLVCLGNVQPGMRVLIHSACGGVGIWANRICQHMQAVTIGTVGHPSKVNLAEKEGYQHVIVRDQKTFEKELRRGLDGESLDLVMESIGGNIMETGYRALGPMGRMIVFGSAHYGRLGDKPFYPSLIWKYLRRPRIDPQKMIRENKSVMAFNLIYLFEELQLMHEILQALSLLEIGEPLIGHRFAFDELPQAIRLLQSGKTSGKVVVNL